jgi:hypothetical protein
MAKASGIPTTDRAFLKVALENVAPRKCISAKDAHVGSVTSVYGRLAKAGEYWAIVLTSKHMPLQVLGM